jgi:hypothetical protein
MSTKTAFDIKSILIGFLLALCITMALGLRNQSNETGRYQILAGATGATLYQPQTGHVWFVGGNKWIDCGTPENPKSICFWLESVDQYEKKKEPKPAEDTTENLTIDEILRRGESERSPDKE